MPVPVPMLVPRGLTAVLIFALPTSDLHVLHNVCLAFQVLPLVVKKPDPYAICKKDDRAPPSHQTGPPPGKRPRRAAKRDEKKAAVSPSN